MKLEITDRQISRAFLNNKILNQDFFSNFNFAPSIAHYEYDRVGEMARDTTKISSAAFEYSAGHTILRLVSISELRIEIKDEKQIR